MTTIPELHFKDADGVIDWHKENIPESYARYVALLDRIKASGMQGSAQLIRNLRTKQVAIFLSFLTEANIAGVLLDKSVPGLAYEPKQRRYLDFVFEGVALSVKNLHAKDYEKNEQARIEELRVEGGGHTTFSHKDISSVDLKVERTAMGTFAYERTEMGNKGFLGSDLAEMSPALKYIGDFETADAGQSKKVLFFFLHSPQFSQIHIHDIAIWYLNVRVPRHRPLLESSPELYFERFGQPTKKNSIDALIFMKAPLTLLSWPANCMGEVRNNTRRLQIYSRDKELSARLKTIFS